MMRNSLAGFRALTCFFAVLAVTACATQRPSQRLEGVYRSGRFVESALAIGISHNELSDLVRTLATEIQIAKDHAPTEPEKAALEKYSKALKGLKDSLSYWKAQIESARYEWAKDAVVLDDSLVEIAKAYGIKTVKAKLPYSSQEWTAGPEIGTQIIWAQVGKDLTDAAALYLALK